MIEMSFIKKSDPYSESMAKNVEKGFFDDDIFTTMRFSHLYPDEQYSETMAFGNGRLWLQTGIVQWEAMVDTLEKWKGWKATGADPEKKPDKVDAQANYNPEEVDDIIERWKGNEAKHIIGYDNTLSPWHPKNLVWVLNHGWRYNRPLMYYIGFFEPVQRAHLNTRYAVDSRTFNALVKLGMAERGREETVEREDAEKKKAGWKSKLNPFK
jgi:hypothetical protein